MCNIILRTVDPRTTELRKPRKVEDLLIAARNNWTIGFDNFSWMSWEFSDTLCMIATGISSRARTLYTDDEEHTFTVRRPVIFNGIPGDLTERSDLASRTIKLEIPRIVQRRTKSDLEREFEAIWPGVLGALLDGLVGGLRDQSLLIAARNNWTIGFDNFSSMSWEFSDTLCMIATGISSGARTLYTDDEEHTFTVRRPVIFNGIPGDLTERSD